MAQNYRRRWAVVVGVRDYADTARASITNLDNVVPRLSSNASLLNLDNAVHDACRVYRLLTRHYGFTGRLLAKPENVEETDQRLYVGQPGLKHDAKACGTARDILDAFSWVVREGAKPDDLFVFFFSGHGSKENLGYLIPYGAEEGHPSTYLMYEALWHALSLVPCRDKLLLFDCCYAGLAVAGARVPDSALNAYRAGVEKRKVVFCATDAFTVTPDSYMSYEKGDGQRSDHSPFVEALASRLEKAMPGETINSRSLFDHIYDRVTKEFLPLPIANPGTEQVFKIEPTCWPEDVTIDLQKPGIKIESSPVVFVRAGKTERLKLTASGGLRPYTWALEGPPLQGIRLSGDLVTFDGTQLSAGVHRLELRVTDRQQTFERHPISVRVLSREVRPLVLTTHRMDPSFVGKPYRFTFQADGGMPPFVWEVANLPRGLSLDPLDGAITGVIPRGTDSAVATSEHLLQIKVTDLNCKLVERTVRLPVVDLERYCEVPSGPSLIGYHPTPGRTHELDRLGIRDQVARKAATGFPSGEVYLPRFFIKRHPVTNREWQEFRNLTGHPAKPRRWSVEGFGWKQEGDLPVTDISYDDMLAYCKWQGSRLPSGWEWEKAARGADGRLFSWGDEFNPNFCNCPELQWGALTQVDQFPEAASEFGVLDMSGNACECVRQFHEAYEEWRPVLRGGSFADETVSLMPSFGKLAAREWNFQLDDSAGHLKPAGSAMDPRIGFRDVIEVVDAPTYPQGFVPLDGTQFVLPGTKIEVSTPPVFLARYAVSNEEYYEFIQRTGRARPLHWQKNGVEPFPFVDRHLPVTNVSFADAESFCRWKSQEDQLGIECRIMTLRIWRAAVFGPGREPQGFVPRQFPWGDDYSPLRCNGRDTGWGGPMRVFELPEGRGTCGAYHLVGNVAQWVGLGQTVGGSWLQDCRNPAHWVESIDPAETKHRCDIGFRYYCSHLVRENPVGLT